MMASLKVQVPDSQRGSRKPCVLDDDSIEMELESKDCTLKNAPGLNKAFLRAW